MSVQFNWPKSPNVFSDSSGARVKSAFGRDRAWWDDRLRWYRTLRPEADCPSDVQMDMLFNSTFITMADIPGRSELMEQLGQIVDFWLEHPGVEELLCK